MKVTQITTFALLGLAATGFIAAAAAKPDNGRDQGNRPTAETGLGDVEETAEVGRGNRPVPETEIGEAVEQGPDLGRGNRSNRGPVAGEGEPEFLPTEPADEFNEVGGRSPGSLPPGIQRQVERGDGLPPGLQRQVERGDGLPPGLRR